MSLTLYVIIFSAIIGVSIPCILESDSGWFRVACYIISLLYLLFANYLIKL